MADDRMETQKPSPHLLPLHKSTCATPPTDCAWRHAAETLLSASTRARPFARFPGAKRTDTSAATNQGRHTTT
eukprot:1118328-Prorocentrum_minimum.AAC.1